MGAATTVDSLVTLPGLAPTPLLVVLVPVWAVVALLVVVVLVVMEGVVSLLVASARLPATSAVAPTTLLGTAKLRP
jgi:hypothetical protein